MKKSLLILLLLSSVAAFAGDLAIVQVPNGHGQTTPMYRDNSKVTVALFVSGSRKATAPEAKVKLAPRESGHGINFHYVR